MTGWQLPAVLIAMVVCATALIGWWLYLKHRYTDEPED
jgi:hypothetical protein